MAKKGKKLGLIAILILISMLNPLIVPQLNLNTANKNQSSDNNIGNKLPKLSNGKDFEANDFQLKTLWNNYYGTEDTSDLPYQKIIKSKIGDFNGDGSDDFIFTDGVNLWVMDKNGSIIYNEKILANGAFPFIDLEIGNFTDSPGVDILIAGYNFYITGNDFFTIYSYPGIDVLTVETPIGQIDVANIDPNNPYDEIILTNYTSRNNPSTVYVYNSKGEILWRFNDTLRNIPTQIDKIAVGYDLDGDGLDDDIVGFNANNNPYWNITIYAINESGNLIYLYCLPKINTYDFADLYAVGNFNTSTTADEIVFTIDDLHSAVMIQKPASVNQNATIGWTFVSTNPYDLLMAGDNLIEGSGAREDLLFGYHPTSNNNNYIIEIRNGSNANTLNWSKTFEDVGNVVINISDLDNDGMDEILIGDEKGYLTVYEAPGIFNWKQLYGGQISIINTKDIVGDNDQEIIIHPTGHLVILYQNGTIIQNIGNSKILYILDANLDNDANRELIAFFQDNRILGIDDDGTLLWSYLSNIPTTEVYTNFIMNRWALMDKDNDGIDDYLYCASAQLGKMIDVILDLSTAPPTIKKEGILSAMDVVVGDFDKDGQKDDFITGGLDIRANTFTISGDYYNLWTTTTKVGDIINIINDIAVGDFNGDNYDDIVCTFWSINESNSNNSPINKSLVAYDGSTGNIIFKYDNLNGTRGIIETADFDGDNIDEIVVGYNLWSGNSNLTVLKRTGSTAKVTWSKTLSGPTKQIVISDFNNDTYLDVAALTWANQIHMFNGSDGNLIGTYSTSLTLTNLAYGKINNEDKDSELISGAVSSEFSQVNVYNFNYSEAIPQTFGVTNYPEYQYGDIYFIGAANITGGTTDNIYFGTTKGAISVLTPFKTKEIKSLDVNVLLQNETAVAGEKFKIYFEIERNEPDIIKKISMDLIDWKSGDPIETYVMDNSIKGMRIEPGITKISTEFILPIDIKGKFYITGKISFDNFSDYDIFNDAREWNFATIPFDVNGKDDYTRIKQIDSSYRRLDFMKFIDFNFTIENTQAISDNIILNISVCYDNFIVNTTSENLIISGGNELKLTRKLYVPYKIPSDLIAFAGLIYITINGRQGIDAKTQIIHLSDRNGVDVGLYYSRIRIINSTNNEIFDYRKGQQFPKVILQINRSATQNIENFTFEATYYNEYNFICLVGAIYLASGIYEIPTIFSNDTGDPNVAINYGSNPYQHPAKTNITYYLNFSFAQTYGEGIHTMYLIILAINPNTFRFEQCGFELKYNLTGILNNSLSFIENGTINKPIIQAGQNVTATTTINFTYTPQTKSNLTAFIRLEEMSNKSHYINKTKIYNITGLKSLTINLSLNTADFADSLVYLTIGILKENYSGFIMPWRNEGISNRILWIISIEDSCFYQKDVSTQKTYKLKYGNITINGNFAKNVKLFVNSFNAYTNPARNYITELQSQWIKSIGFWSITGNSSISSSDINGNLQITINYLPTAAFSQRIHESDLIPYYYNESTDKWEQIQIFTRNVAANTIQFSISHLSDFAIGGAVDTTEQLIKITTSFANGKTRNKQIIINWESVYSDWAQYWDYYEVYLNDILYEKINTTYDTVILDEIEKSHTIKVIGYDINGKISSDEISVWLDLSKIFIKSVSDNIKNGSSLPSTGYLKLTWESSSDIQYYIIKVNGEIKEENYKQTSYEFIFSESGTYNIEIIGVDGYGDKTTLRFTVSYEAPDRSTEISKEIDTNVLIISIGASAIIAVIGIVLLIIRKDKTVDYSKLKA
ncbi:MAG: hypothetical protein ACP6IY_12680 [Promethearchaeia archaeon]